MYINLDLSVDELDILDELICDLSELPGGDCTYEDALHYLIYYYKARKVARSSSNEVA